MTVSLCFKLFLYVNGNIVLKKKISIIYVNNKKTNIVLCWYMSMLLICKICYLLFFFPL